MPEHYVHQCMKCWHKWEQGTLLRQDGKDRTKCPKCNSNQTLLTRAHPTEIVITEDLLMFSGGQYPNRYCGETSLEELYSPIGRIIDENGIRVSINRGFSNPKDGHYVYLFVDRKLWMTTDKDEKESMEWSVRKCPEHARIFVGGLGLGLILLTLAHTKKPIEVLVAEKEHRVIDAVEPIIRKWFNVHYPWFKWTVICGDAIEEVAKHGKWDWIFFDIWSDRYGKQDEPKEDEVKSKATPYLTEKGVLTIWTMVLREIHDSKVDPKLAEFITKQLLNKNGLIPLK